MVVGRKVSTQARRERGPGRSVANFGCIGAFNIIGFDYNLNPPPNYNTPQFPSSDVRISSLTDKMSQPVVQTIHRDPALL